jgi:hypothetical protein
MPFLHWETHEFCTKILFYNFHIDFIALSWYYKFVRLLQFLLIRWMLPNVNFFAINHFDWPITKKQKKNKKNKKKTLNYESSLK